MAGACENHILVTPGGLRLVVENKDVAFGDASLEVDRHSPAGSFNRRPQWQYWSCSRRMVMKAKRIVNTLTAALSCFSSLSDIFRGAGASIL